MLGLVVAAAITPHGADAMAEHTPQMDGEPAISRIDEIREMLLQDDQLYEAEPGSGEAVTAQWYNWNNWPNWGNWGNWPNWTNWWNY